ncbi:MAG: NAD(P)H-binding protein, partial [Pseudomonadota bacterium]
LLTRDHDVTCLVRRGLQAAGLPDAITLRHCDVTDPVSLAHDGFRGETFDAVVSCLASRTGVPADAWAIDHGAHMNALEAAREAGVSHFVLLSAICVQRPLLGFQQAKLAFEAALRNSGLRYSIVRPTAFFKSLSGQVPRVMAGKPCLLFGDGRLTACKPISNRDLADYIVSCLDNPIRWNAVLPVGGPGPAITPREQGERLFEILGQAPRFRSVPVGLIKSIAGALGAAGRIIPPLVAKAELARIGHYYATESMLVLNPETGRYDADATPEHGSDTLFDHYARLVRGEIGDERGDHAVF